MPSIDSDRLGLRPARAALAAGAAAVVLACALALPQPAPAGKGKVLGAANSVPASCPQDCLVEARVTGFQTMIEDGRDPFRVPNHGRIVAWSIKLGTPAKEDVKHFNQRFGSSQARLAVLKPVKLRKGKRGYRLLRQGPIENLGPFFGETTTFGLQRALKVRKGNVIALTIPTWATAAPTAAPACSTRLGSSAREPDSARVRSAASHPRGAPAVRSPAAPRSPWSPTVAGRRSDRRSARG
jgi:hypothetical protein